MEEIKNSWCLIPHEIWIADNINLQEKCLLGRIMALAVSTGSCFSSNNYLADELKKSVPQIKTMLNHLEKLGYIERIVIYKENSKEIEKRLINPVLKITLPSIKNNTTPGIKNNPDRVDILDENIEKISKPTAHPQLGELLDLFKKVNPSYRLFFANKTQRSCLQRLIEQHSYEKTKAMIELLPDLIDKPYAPVVTSPYELEKNLGKIIAYVAKERTKNGSKFAKMD